MSVINFVAKPYFLHQHKKLRKVAENPAFFQQKTLLELLHKARNTSFGKEHSFSAIKSREDFAAQVPVRDYTALFPYIERMLHGEQNVLWNNIHQFSRSSGTTSGRSKFIPVSDKGLMQTHIATAKHFISYYLHSYPQSNFFNGKGIVLSGSYYTNYDFAKNINVADVSTLLYHYTDSWINFIKAVPSDIALLSDSDKNDKNRTNFNHAKRNKHFRRCDLDFVAVAKSTGNFRQRKSMRCLAEFGINFARWRRDFSIQRTV
ncbi:MAG: GH3 auxin-responsive promoter family protein [Pirellulales bacterium]